MDESKQFECPICLKILYRPVTTSCGHNFCKHCIDQTIIVNEKCPMCRVPLSSDYAPNVLLTDIIRDRFPEAIRERESFIRSFLQETSQSSSTNESNQNLTVVWHRKYHDPPLFEGDQFSLLIRNTTDLDTIKYSMNHDQKLIVVNTSFKKTRPICSLVQIKPLDSLVNLTPQMIPISIKTTVISRVKLNLPTSTNSLNLEVAEFNIFNDKPFHLESETSSDPFDEQQPIINKLNEIQDKISFSKENDGSIPEDLSYIKNNSHLMNNYSKYICCTVLINMIIKLLKRNLSISPSSLNRRFQDLYGSLPMPVDVTQEPCDVEKTSLKLLKMIAAKTDVKWSLYSTDDSLHRLIVLIDIVVKAGDSNIFDLGDNDLFPSWISSMDPLVSGIVFLIVVVVVSYWFKHFKRRRY